MIGYVTVGTNDHARALAFYDALIGEIGGRRLSTLPGERGFTLYGTGFDAPMLAVTRPYDGGTADTGNGGMVALVLESRDRVDAVHARALALGASDEGAPGLRAPESMGFYGAYVRDPDGNKLCFYKIG
ncbi:VOC family protein [Sphingomonas sp. KR1UV-12]|uniref:VOC family protein n=2 Tax=Sphingomonas aurea TaxID=3063994 RepID=A0ABT9EMS9_9SPHN|nr:VOC family protein [Sphingomonas sp. KR1UV-12]MDP1028264.1 VOC family protein [Sphingomonas sp. KR1UV-12]